MKKMKRIVSLVLVVVVIIGSLSGCGGKGKINEVLDNFESACNSFDVSEILDCIDPQYAGPVRDIYDLYRIVAREKAEESFAELIQKIFGVKYDPSDFLGDLKIEDRIIKSSGRRSTVRCVLAFKMAGELFRRDAIIKLKKLKDTWYITGIEIDKYKDDDRFFGSKRTANNS